MNKWNAQDIERLKQLYPIMTNKELMEEFKGRSYISLYKKAYSLGLERDYNVEFKNRSTGREWTHSKCKNYKGYVLVYKPEHPRADRSGKVFEHIIVWEEYNNQRVPDGYIVHHINEKKDDNRIKNLQLMTIGEHTKYHHMNKKLSDETKLKISKGNKGKLAGEKNRLYKDIDISKMKELIDDGETITNVCKMFNIHRTTYYKKLKESNNE